MGYLDGTHKLVLPKEVGYQTWFGENSMVMAYFTTQQRRFGMQLI